MHVSLYLQNRISGHKFSGSRLGALDGVVEFPTEPSDNSSNLGISMEDYINH